MRRIVLGAAAVILSSCASSPEAPREPTFVPASIERHYNDVIAKGRLTEPAVIDGIPCQGWLQLHEDGHLAAFELAANATIRGLLLPAASYVWLDDNGRLQTCFLSRDTDIDGYACRGGPFRIATSFHDNGRLRAFVPRDEVVIDDIRCASTMQTPIVLFPDGKLARCRLAADAELSGHKLLRGETIELDAAGHLLPAR